MKNKLIGILSTLTLMISGPCAAVDFTQSGKLPHRYLTVKNKWTQDVHIEEGFFYRRKADVHPAKLYIGRCFLVLSD